MLDISYIMTDEFLNFLHAKYFCVKEFALKNLKLGIIFRCVDTPNSFIFKFFRAIEEITILFMR